MIKHSLFCIPVVCLADNFKFDPESIEGTFAEIEIGVKHQDTPEGLNEAVAAIYSALLQMTYPDSASVPVHAVNSSLPSNGDVFENSVHLRSYLKINNMQIGRSKDRGDFLCHTDLLLKEWTKEYFSKNPSGFGKISTTRDIDAQNWSELPDSNRLDVTVPYSKLVRFDILEMIKTQYESGRLDLQSFAINSNFAA